MKWAFYLLLAGTIGSGVMALAATAPTAAKAVKDAQYWTPFRLLRAAPTRWARKMSIPT